MDGFGRECVYVSMNQSLELSYEIVVCYCCWHELLA